MIPIPGTPRPPEPPRPTSMCLEINDFTHQDCNTNWCGCSCHNERETK